MELLSSILKPVILSMNFVLDLLYTMLDSWGLGILVLSAIVSILLMPLNQFGRNIENRIDNKMQSVRMDISQIDQSLKGEERFNQIEHIFQSHRYHPIHQVLKGTSILMLLPFLFSALILFNQHRELAGSEFWFINDLSKPDKSIWELNILPLIMFLITLTDALIRFKDNKSGFYQYLALSMILVVLVYNMPAALLLFWIGNNTASMLIFQFQTLHGGKKYEASRF